MEYKSLEQRMARAYLSMFPAFVSKENADVSVDEQKEFYDFMKKLFQLLFDDPFLIISKLHEDDAFPSRYKKGYGKPELEVNVLKIKKAIESLLNTMFLMGQKADVKLNKRQLHILSLLGIEDTTKLPTAWTWMSTRPNANQVAFAYCLFDENHVYATEVYRRLLGNEAYHKLEQWLITHGYKPYDIYNTKWVDYQLSLSYVNPAWGEERPNVGNEYKIKHTGIAVQYDAYVNNPTALGVCIPYGLKHFLQKFDVMSQTVKDFVIDRTKNCDGCNYCIQTDKTGTRPLAYIPITHNQKEFNLCPYFPGYAYSFTSIDDNLVDKIIALLSFMDGFSSSLGQRSKRG